MLYLKYLALSCLLLLAPLVPAKVDNPAVFETWEDYISRPTEHRDSPQKNQPTPSVAKSSVVGQTNDSSAPGSPIGVTPPTAKKQSEDPLDEYLVRFGAGARWLLVMRTTDGSMEDNLLSVFSASVSPYGIVGEVGVDLALGKNSTFFFEPNLKFFFVKHAIISIYLEGAFAIYSRPSSTHYGGGASIGVIGGMMEHLSLELRASTLLFNMNDVDSSSLLNANPDPSNDKKALILCPSLEVRLMARF